MAKNALWSDEYWLLLMRLYLRKPEGVKPMYSKEMVKLALELHIQPQFGWICNPTGMSKWICYPKN